MTNYIRSKETSYSELAQLSPILLPGERKYRLIRILVEDPKNGTETDREMVSPTTSLATVLF
jgi:hypothetical protein